MTPTCRTSPSGRNWGARVRNGFIAEQGNLLLSVDYSQIELRIVAHMAQDAGMLAAFRAGQDIHATTAAAIYDIPLEKVTKDQRRHAKAINFGLIYGMSAFGLTRSTDLTLAEAEDFVKEYFREFPGVKNYLDGIRKFATEKGYVETLLGRRRYFPALMGQMNRNLRNREEREAINAPIQGTAADIMKTRHVADSPGAGIRQTEGADAAAGARRAGAGMPGRRVGEDGAGRQGGHGLRLSIGHSPRYGGTRRSELGRDAGGRIAGHAFHQDRVK